MDVIRADIRRALRRRRPPRRRGPHRAAARLDHRLDLRRRAGPSWPPPASPRPAPVPAAGVGAARRLARALPAAAARRTPSSCQPVRLHRVQGAVALPGLLRTVRPREGAVTVTITRAGPPPAGLPPAARRRRRPAHRRRRRGHLRRTRAELRETFAFAAGQHLTVRRVAERRRGRAPVVLDLLDPGRPGRGTAGCGSGCGRSPAARSPAFACGALRGRRHRRGAAAAGPLHHRVRAGPGAGTTARSSPAPASPRCCRWSRPRWPSSRPARFTLVYGNRTAGTVMFAEELADLKDRYPTRLHLVHVLSREPRRVAAALRPDRRRPAGPAAGHRSCRPTASTSGSSAARTAWWSTPGRC